MISVAVWIGGERMSDLWAYVPDVCDGDFCPQDCDHCYKKYEAEEAAYAAENE